MTAQSTSGAQLGGFRPEKLLGQLKAEQLSRNHDTAVRFIDAVLGVQLDSCALRDGLRDGVVLCQLINALRPGAVKRINTKSLPFAQMENISNFLAAAQSLGLDSSDLFQTVDLYEGKNMPRVVMTLLTIARVVAGIPLNSHRKLSDAQRTLGDGWNSTTLTAHEGISLSAPPTEYISVRNQPTLVNSGEAALGSSTKATHSSAKGGPLLLTSAPISSRSSGGGGGGGGGANCGGKTNRARNSAESRERRRSKRRSAATLFTDSTSANRPLPTIEDIDPEAIDLPKTATEPAFTFSEAARHLILEKDVELREGRTDSPAELVRSAGPTTPLEPLVSAETAVSAETTEPATPLVSLVSAEPATPLVSLVSAETAVSTEPLVSAETAVSAETEERPTKELAPPVRQRKRGNTRSRPKERLTVYSESANRLTNYQLGNCIGRGQFGSVYRALDLETGEMVAVKQISLEGQDAESMEDVMQEVELLKSLSSPRIVRYYGFVKTDAHLNLVMEFVENGSLSATLKSFGTFPERLVLAYVVKIIEGLIYLHKGDVVHCDLKACNILTTKNGNTKLTDFGVSLNLKLRRPDDESVVAGTPYWMAPEIIQLDGACTASDIWSLGCTIIELLTGKPPYSDLMQMPALYRIVEDDHPPIPEGISEELKDFLLLCFRKDPSDRPTAQGLMDHPWMQQYRRHRKEMKMLRRTCSRKMSSYMARKQSTRDYPTFNPTQLKPLAARGCAATNDGSDAGSWEEEEEEGGDNDDREGGHISGHSEATAVTMRSSAMLEPANAIPQPTKPGASMDLAQGTDETALLEPNLADAGGGIGPREPRRIAKAATAPSASDNVEVVASGDDTDGSISTFEGPRLKHHRLRTILCDTNSVCAVCPKTLSGTFIQCASCKIRCHDACTQQLQPCSAMRMSRFLYPANRKSSKRYENRVPNIRLRAGRRRTMRRQNDGPTGFSAAEAQLGSVCTSHVGGLLGSSDGSLNVANLREPGASARMGMMHDGFDGTMDTGMAQSRPATIAVALGSLPDGRSYPEAQYRFSGPAADSGWETDDAPEAIPRSSAPNPAGGPVPIMRQGPAPANIRIPQTRRDNGPFSAPLASARAADGPRRSMDSSGTHQPAYYKALSGKAGPSPELPPKVGTITPLSERARPRSIRRMRANTASLEHLPGERQDGSGSGGISTLFKRRQHPLRGATSSDIRAVAGFSPGAAQRAKRTYHRSGTAASDLQSCTTSELFFSASDVALSNRASTQCFSVTGHLGDRQSQPKRFSRGDCIVM
ncbi:Protein kinase of the Mitotic Exit Network [Coemansia sp. RSA 552]|nr:Protein kinase of the Mitotic Exit Network [Coemansia sp. RSA 552]